MKLVESRSPDKKEINQAIDDSVRLLKDIIQMARLGPIPVALMYDLEECLINGVYYLKFQKDLYSKYDLTLEQKYFLTTYYIIINCTSDNNKEHLNLLKDICRSIGYQSEEIQDPDFRKRFYYAVNQPRKLSYGERVLMHKTGKDFNIKPERQNFRDSRSKIKI